MLALEVGRGGLPPSLPAFPLVLPPPSRLLPP